MVAKHVNDNKDHFIYLSIFPGIILKKIDGAAQKMYTFVYFLSIFYQLGALESQK